MRLVSLYAALLLLPALALAGTPQPTPTHGIPRPHEALRAAHRGAPVPTRPWRVLPGPLEPVPGKQDHVVFGYLPYWELDYQAFRWDLLTHIAWFSVELSASGDLTDGNHFADPSTAALVAEAHSHGVAVVLCVTDFDSGSIGAFLGSASARSKAIGGLVALVTSQGADGVNVDFEGVPIESKAQFVSFLAELKAAVAAAVPGGGHVSIASPAVDWAGSYDYDAIAAAIDAVFVMAYDYHWKGGDPGPICPLAPSDGWGKYSLGWTLDDYAKWGGDVMMDKLVVGLPLYGYDWPSSGASPHASATGKGSATLWGTAQTEGMVYGWKWDGPSESPWYVYQKGGVWRQAWVVTAESLGQRMDAAVARGLPGIGFWALGYDEGDDAVWDEVEARFPSAQEVSPGEDVGPADAGSWEDASSAAPADAGQGGDVEAVLDAGTSGWVDVAGAGEDGTTMGGGPTSDSGASGLDTDAGGASFVLPGAPDGGAGVDGGFLGPTGPGASTQRTSADDGCHTSGGAGGLAPMWGILAWLVLRRGGARRLGGPCR